MLAVATLASAVLVLGFRAVASDPGGLIFGDRLDSIHHVWGIWWASATGGPSTDLVSFPSGEQGSLLAPLTTLAVQPVRALAGAAFAHTVLGALALGLSAIGVGVLARVLGARPASSALAALLFLGARPVLGQVAMGNPEGAVLGPLLLGIAAGLVWPTRGPSFGLWVGALLGISVIENPYTLVPAGALAPWLAWRRVVSAPPHEDRLAHGRAVALAVVGGCGVVAARLWFTAGDMGGNLPAAWSTRILDVPLPIVDPTAFPLRPLLVPTQDTALTGTSGDIVQAGMLVWPGWLAAVLALACPRPRRGLWLAALLALWLSMGSVPFGTESRTIGPFLLVNALLDAVYHPLTQPSRFLPMAVAALAIAAALGVDRLGARLKRPRTVALGIAALAVVEAATLGALRLEVGTVDVRDHACWVDARAGGAVHLVGVDSGASLPVSAQAMLGQLFHQNPTTARGIGGWTRRPASSDWQTHVQRFDQGIRRRHQGRDWLRATRALAAGGIHWVAVPEALETALPAAVIGRCQGWSIWRMSDVQRTVVSSDGPPPHSAGPAAEPAHAAVPPPSP